MYIYICIYSFNNMTYKIINYNFKYYWKDSRSLNYFKFYIFIKYNKKNYVNIYIDNVT